MINGFKLLIIISLEAFFLDVPLKILNVPMDSSGFFYQIAITRTSYGVQTTEKKMANY